jgi:hypothetical protein
MLKIFMIIQKEIPYLQNMNTNAVYPYCKPYYSDKEPNNFGYPVSLMYLGYNTQKPL